MTTFKQFLEADGMPPAQPAPQQQSAKLKGSLTDNENRVLAILSANAIKSSPGRARQLLSGDQNLVQAVKGLKLNFKAIDVTADGVTINQTGTTLAQNQGVVDPNSGELTELGIKLATTLPTGGPNPKTKDLAGAVQRGNQQPTLNAQQPAGQFPPMESFNLLRKVTG